MYTQYHIIIHTRQHKTKTQSNTQAMGIILIAFTTYLTQTIHIFYKIQQTY